MDFAQKKSKDRSSTKRSLRSEYDRLGSFAPVLKRWKSLVRGATPHPSEQDLRLNQSTLYHR